MTTGEPIPALAHGLVDLAVERFVLRGAPARASAGVVRVEAEPVEVEARPAVANVAWAAATGDAHAA